MYTHSGNNKQEGSVPSTVTSLSSVAGPTLLRDKRALLPDNSMLIQTSANCKNYKTIVADGFHGGIANRGEFVCPNPDCRCDVFHIHDTYDRSILTYDPFPEDYAKPSFKISDGLFLVLIELKLLRVKCAGCGATHIIAPADMIPFKAFSISAFLLLMLQVFLQNEANRNGHSVLHPREDVCWHVLRRMFLIYQKYRARMMAALRLEGLHTAASDLSDIDLIRTYLDHPPPSEAQLSFLRCYIQPLFTITQNNGSHRIRYLLPKELFG